MEIITIYIIIHIICGILAYGITLAYFTREYTSEADQKNYRLALFMAICGPLGFIISYALSGLAKHGLLFILTKNKE